MRTVIVVAGVLLEGGRVLVTQRKDGAHFAGLWEFPGGKVEPGEDPRGALVRELREELGIEVTVGEAVEVTFHRPEGADHALLLLFFRVMRAEGSPSPRAIDVADLRWAERADLDALSFPPADAEMLDRVRALLS